MRRRLGQARWNVTPAGKVLPCHAAESIPGLEFWSVREHSLTDIWTNSPAFNAFRGIAWMQEPRASCARREIDFGGRRCQAFAPTGDARATEGATPRGCRRAGGYAATPPSSAHLIRAASSICSDMIFERDRVLYCVL